MKQVSAIFHHEGSSATTGGATGSSGSDGNAASAAKAAPEASEQPALRKGMLRKGLGKELERSLREL